jgi:hypothetical protein
MSHTSKELLFVGGAPSKEEDSSVNEATWGLKKALFITFSGQSLMIAKEWYFWMESLLISANQ